MGYVVARGESVLVPGAVSLVFLAIGALGLRELLRWRGHGLRLSSSGVSDARWKGNRQIAWSEVRAIEESRGGIWIGGADSEAGLTRDGENYLVLPAILKSLVPKEALWKKR
jgi:hypothetical protein